MQTNNLLENEQLPLWQAKLIDQIVHTFAKYYCIPEKINSVAMQKQMEQAFRNINHEFKEENQDRPDILQQILSNELPPGDLLEKSKFLEKVNTECLYKIDLHLRLDAGAQCSKLIVRDSQHGKGIIFDPENKCAYFDTVIIGQKKPTKEELEEAIAMAKKENFGFAERPPTSIDSLTGLYESEKLLLKDIPNDSDMTIPDDVGYIRINQFFAAELPGVKETCDEIMQKMSDKQAIIIDLRYHFGGDPRMVEYFISYFFEKTGTPIFTLENFVDHSIEEYNILPQKLKLLNVPIYVLTSPVTCSAGESTAYNLQQMANYNIEGAKNRFEFIGQITSGGAHSWYIFPLVEFDPKTAEPQVNKEMVIYIPIRMTKNAYSQTNWEDHDLGKGMHPEHLIEINQSGLFVALQKIHKAHLQNEATEKTRLSNANTSIYAKREDDSQVEAPQKDSTIRNKPKY